MLVERNEVNDFHHLFTQDQFDDEPKMVGNSCDSTLVFGYILDTFSHEDQVILIS